MKYLLDTHCFLWFIQNSQKLSSQCKIIIENPNNELFLSMASLWEMAIKFSLGKLKIQEPFGEFLLEQLQINQIQLLNINPKHICEVISLPFHHRDPFDRIIIAQGIQENLLILSKDENFPKYPVTVIW